MSKFASLAFFEAVLLLIGLLGHYVNLPHIKDNLLLQFLLDVFLIFPLIHIVLETMVLLKIRICHIFSYQYVKNITSGQISSDAFGFDYDHGITFRDIEFPSLSDYPMDLN
ncbi:hypothetical protein HYV31_03045 [candidate division WWE3 bacterium]|nr:hypothetical protein [candidate division WWE3 bacterium]